MPLLNAKCTNCGATLQVDGAKDAAICPACGSAFIVEKAVNNYNITNTFQSPGVVNIYGSNSGDFDIRGGVLIKYNGASMTPVVPNTVVKIGNIAFQGAMITDVTLPDTLLTIGGQAFERCSRLKQVRLPNSVTSIEGGEYCGAFSGCTALTSVKIPNSITSIESFTFSNCTGLTSVTIPNSVTSIGSFAFSGCTGLTSVTIPNSVASIGRGAFSHCTKLTSITIPNSVTSIGSFAFSGCTGLTSVTIPNSVTSIESSAFSGCTSLTSVTIPKSVSTIELHVFQGCTALTSVTIQADVSVLHCDDPYYGVFLNCPNISAVNLPRGAKLPGGFLYNFDSCPYKSEYWRSQGKCIYCGNKRNLFGKCERCGKRS